MNNQNIFQYITSKYNLLRVFLFDVINYYTSVQNYHIQYLKFISFIKDKYSQLVLISQAKIKTFTIPNNKDYKRKRLKLQSDTILIIGLSNYYKYISIKYIMNKIMNYNKKLYSYLIYLETCIVRVIQGMNNFRNIYTYSLSILFNSLQVYDNNEMLLLNSFNKLKQNYFSKSAPYLNL